MTTENERLPRGKHPNSLKNLKPYPKGVSGHPGRTPKDCSLTSLVKAEIDKVPPGEKQGRTWRQILVLTWLTGAMKNPILFKELLERLEGKVTDKTELTGKSGGPLEFKAIELTDEQLAVIAAQDIISNPR